MKRILILHTGGTIGSIETQDGKTPAKTGDFSKLVRSLPLFSEGSALPIFEILELEPLIGSTNATPKDWQRLAQAVNDYYADYDGIVVTHGTDTLAYGAAALSFALQNVEKPIIVTGAQVPLFEENNDGANNLYRSLQLAASDLCGVFVFFHDRLMHGATVLKNNSVAYQGFDSPRAPLVGWYDAETFITPPDSTTTKATGPFTYSPYKDKRVDLIHLYPGISVDFLRRALTPLPHALVVETYGVGTAPSDPEMVNFFQSIIEQGCITVFVSECFVGTARPGPYVENTVYQKAGVICGYDMTTAAAITKLHHLLSKHEDRETIKSALLSSLAYEMRDHLVSD